MRTVWVVALGLVLVGAFSGCGGGGDSNGVAPAAAIVIAQNDASNPTGFSFSPAQQTVVSGQHVIWVNNSAAPHSIVWDSTTPSTSPGPGASVPQFDVNHSSQDWVAPTVTTQTTYAYHCGVHGPNMAGTIVVNP